MDQAYQRYFPLMRGKCRRMLGASGEADDAAQEAFVRLWRSGLLGKATETHICAWLYRVSTHLALDRLRSRKLAAPSVTNESVSPESLASTRQQLALLARRAPKDALAAAALCRIDGLGHIEAAQVLGISERTLRRLLDRFDAAAKEFFT